MNKWDLAVEAARKSAERDAATSKGQARKRRSRSPHRSRSEIQYVSAQHRRKIQSGRSARRRKPLNPRQRGDARNRGSRGHSFAGATQGVHGFSDLRQKSPALRLRKTRPRQTQIPQLRADRFSLRKNRRPRQQIISADRSGCRRAQEAHPHAGTESLAQGRSRSPTRHDAQSAPRQDLLPVQAKTSPPTFLLFTNQKDPLHFSYQRFLENQIREKWDFPGAPIRFIQRLRKAERDTREPKSRAEARDEERKKHGPRLMREHETKELDD